MKALPSFLRGSALFFLLLVCVISAHAQTGYTIVSGTVIDPFGFPYSGGFPGGATISATIIPVGTTNLRLNGNSISGQIQTAALDQNGHFQLAFPDNNLITPTGTQWKITVNGRSQLPYPIGTGSQTLSVTLLITGASMDISTQLSAAAPSLTNVCPNIDLSPKGCGGAIGSVTSVGLAAPTGIIVSGSPVTSSGTLTWAMPTGWDTGSLLLGVAPDSVATLTIGANTDVLTSNGTTASWQPPTGCPLSASNGQVIYDSSGICTGSLFYYGTQTTGGGGGITAGCTNASYGAATCIQYATTANPGSGPTATVALANTLGAGHLYQIFASWCSDGFCNSQPSTIAFADNGCGETYNAIPGASAIAGNPFAPSFATYYVFNSVGGCDQITATVTSSGVFYLNLTVTEWNGPPAFATTNSLDQSNVANTGSTVSTTAPTVAATELVCGVASETTNPTITSNSPAVTTVSYANTLNYSCYVATNIGVQTLTWTTSNGSTQGNIFTFELPGGNTTYYMGSLFTDSTTWNNDLLFNAISANGLQIAQIGTYAGNATISLADASVSGQTFTFLNSSGLMNIGTPNFTTDAFGNITVMSCHGCGGGTGTIMGTTSSPFVPYTISADTLADSALSYYPTGADPGTICTPPGQPCWQVIHTGEGTLSFGPDSIRIDNILDDNFFSQLTDERLILESESGQVEAEYQSTALFFIDSTGNQTASMNDAGTLVLGANGDVGGSVILMDVTSGGSVLTVSGSTLVASGPINATAYQTTTICSSAASPAACGSSAAGSVVVAAAATTVVVDSTAVTAASQIFLMFDSSLGSVLSVTCNTTEPALYGITARTASSSFTITATMPSVNPACFSYLIVN